MIGHRKILELKLRHLRRVILFAFFDTKIVYLNLIYLFIFKFLLGVMRLKKEIGDRSLIVPVDTFKSISWIPHRDNIFSYIRKIQIKIVVSKALLFETYTLP